MSDEWQADGKNTFQKCIRRNEGCKKILSINIYPERLINHYDMISELNIIAKKNRGLKIEFREN